MADPDLVALSTNGGVAAGASILTSFFSRLLRSKAEVEVSTRLALIEAQLATIAATLKEQQGLAIDVALLKRDLLAVHERLDGQRAQRT